MAGGSSCTLCGNRCSLLPASPNIYREGNQFWTGTLGHDADVLRPLDGRHCD